MKEGITLTLCLITTIILSALLGAGCAAQSWPAWSRTQAENDCYDRHIDAACYVARQQEQMAWANATSSWQQAMAPGTVFNPVNVRVSPY